MSFGKSGAEKRVDFGKFTIARLKKGKKIAEMIVDPNKAWTAKKMIDDESKKRVAQGNQNPLTVKDLKEALNIDVHNIYEGFTVFEDAKKGEVYPAAMLEDMFETSDEIEIAYLLLLDKDTEWNWTKEQRDEFIETKRKQIINILAKNCINPQTKKPHPPARLEKAIKEAKYNINSSKSAEEQIKDVISAISAIIPIRMENVELAVKIPASFAPKAYGVVEKFGHVKQSEWQNDGSWVGMLELPAGFEAEFLESVNRLTHGRAEIKVLKRT